MNHFIEISFNRLEYCNSKINIVNSINKDKIFQVLKESRVFLALSTSKLLRLQILLI